VQGRHSPYRLAATQDRADNVYAEYFIECGGCDILDARQSAHHAGGIDEAHDWPLLTRGRIEQSNHVLLTSEIRLDGESAAACLSNFGDQRLCRFLVPQIMNGDGHTPRRHETRDFGANASAGAGDKDGGHLLTITRQRVTRNLLR